MKNTPHQNDQRDLDGETRSILATNLASTRPVVNMALPRAADNRVNTGNLEQEMLQIAEGLCGVIVR